MPKAFTGTKTGDHYIWCPGCNDVHQFDKKRWAFNNNYDKPTFTPSMLRTIGPMPEGHPKAGQKDVCHTFVTDGKIQFLGDCTHAMAGQTVDLPDIPQQTLFCIENY